MPSSLLSLLSTVFRLFGRQNRQQNGQHGLGENVATGRTARLLQDRHELILAQTRPRIDGTFGVRIEPEPCPGRVMGFLQNPLLV